MIASRQLRPASNPALSSMLASMERLFEENPNAFGTFIAWLERPGHSDAVTLHFYQGRLARAERTQIAK